MRFNMIDKFYVNSKIYVAINSFSLLLLMENKIHINDSFIFWPDGIICKFYGFNKVPGREIFNQIISEKFNFCLITSPNIYQKFNHDIQPRIELVEVGYGCVDDIYSNIGFIKSNIIVITLPTPKQESLALLLHEKYKNKTILCLGGAINMYLGLEWQCPNWISKLGLEFIWRLHKDPIRRLKRLMSLYKLYKLLYANNIFIKKY